MIDTGILTVVFDGVVLALTAAFTLLLLWHDYTKRLIASFGLFLLLVFSWNLGSLLLKIAVSFDLPPILETLGISLLEVGFSGASIAFYAFISTLAGVRSQYFFRLTVIAVVFVVVLRLLIGAPQVLTADGLAPRLDNLPGLFYFVYSLLGLNILVFYRRKIQGRVLYIGALLFVIGQGITFLNPSLGIVAVSTNIASVGVLMMAVGIIRREIIRPLAERDVQIATLHNVSKEIVGQPQLEMVLHEIAHQAAEWVGGDATGVFLREDDEMKLAAVYNLPESVRGYYQSLDVGVIGQAARTGRSQLIEDYSRDWRYQPDMPYATENFGAFIAVPLSYQGTVSGVLFAVAGHQGKLFTSEDVFRMELLAPQAALAIGYSNLIDVQRALNRKVESNRQQLESLLISIESPVLAIDRKMQLIFANPAARQLLSKNDDTHNIPQEYLPPNLRALVRDLQLFKVHIYEVGINSAIYQCHVAELGGSRFDGWVVVLNDVTRLKELDRMKGEMIRMVSHDLKNPLMGAFLHVDLLRDKHIEAADESLNIIERQLERMDRIIRGVLDLERIRTGRFQLMPHDLNKLVYGVVADLERLAQEQRIHLNAVYSENELIVMCDADQLERAMTNLVENALKFTPAEGSVTITVRDLDNTNAAVEFADTGIGIREDIQNQVFDRFFRGQQRGFEHVSGNGLGLAIVKSVIDGHQAKITLQSKENEGTIFTLHFKKADGEGVIRDI